MGIKTKILNVPIEKIFIDTNLEIKEIDPIYYKKLSAQIEENGQLLPILVNYRKNEKKCYVIDGKIRFKIFKDLGYQEVLCIIISVSEEKEKVLTLQLTEDFELDILQFGKLVNVVDKIQGLNELAQTTKFDEKQLAKYSEIYDWDWSLFSPESVPEEFGGELKKEEKKYKSLF